jgi:radical SAM superfamily enzyme YgiQ (UPF0313 family)
MSAVLKEAKHTVEVFIDDQGSNDVIIRDLKRFKPDIVGFSLLTPTVPWALGVAKRIKQEIGAITVAGNIHAMIYPQIIEEDGIDIVCIAEGELLIKELAGRIDRQEPYTDIEGFWVKTPEGIIKNQMPAVVLNLDAMPFHDRDLYDKYFFFRKSKYLRFLSGRGCPFRCAFCANSFLLDHYQGKNYLRKRSVAHAISELEYHIKRRKPKHIFFVDEVFWVGNDWLREFAAEYKKKIGIPFTANFRWGRGFSEIDMKMLKEAGLETMIVAIETADEKQRMELLNKRVPDTEIFQVTDWLKKYRVNFGSSSFFGLPGESVDRHIDQLAFFRKVKPIYLWTTFFQPYPGITLTQHQEIQPYLSDHASFGATFHQEMPLDLPDKTTLENLKKVYFLMMIWPRTVPLFRRLIRWRVRLLFDMLFILHFAYYAFKFERVSFLQYLFHLRVFGWNMLFKRKR